MISVSPELSDQTATLDCSVLESAVGSSCAVEHCHLCKAGDGIAPYVPVEVTSRCGVMKFQSQTLVMPLS